MIKISIILPVRNGWPYVQECVESILSQTYPHFELIVLDNQSTDNTVPWLQSRIDSRIQLHYSPLPLSIEDSWARIKDVPKFEYMTLIGHDDKLDPEFLMTIVEAIQNYPDAKLYQTGSWRINSEGRKIRSSKPIPKWETPALYLEGRFANQRDVQGTGSVMRSSDYDRLGGIPLFEKLFFADEALWLSLMHGGFKICTPAKLCSVRMHAGKESTTKPSAWTSILLGINQFSTFLKNYIESDIEAKLVVAKNEQTFFLNYHRNIYILALIEACQLGRTIDRAFTEQIEVSLERCASLPPSALRGSMAVAAIERLNASRLRIIVPPLWNAYHRYWMRAQ